MKTLYKTKADINGNTYGLIIDYDKKQFRRGYGLGWLAVYDRKINSTKKDINALIWIIKKEGYIEIE